MNLLKEGIEKGYVKKTGISKKLTLGGITEVYEVYRVQLDVLFYNDQNDRIATWISKYKVDKNIDFIDMTDIEQYNQIIRDFIFQSNPDSIKRTTVNIDLVGQREPGVVLADGRIIDGNRRYTCLSDLKRKDLKFNWFETVILDQNIKNNEKQIKMLELMLQHGEESKIDYNPIDRLVGIYNDIVEKKLLTLEEYVQSTNETIAEVRKKIELSKLLVDFLDTINAPKQFYIARELDLNGPLVELHAILKKETDDEKIEAIKYAVFTNLLLQPDGDMTRFIRQIKSVVKSKYSDEFLEEQLQIAERVIDDIPKVGNVNHTVVRKIRCNQDLQDKLKKSMNKAVNKVKATEVKNQPFILLDKASDSLGTIDINIINKLNDEQKSEIINKINEINDFLMNIKESINVY